MKEEPYNVSNEILETYDNVIKLITTIGNELETVTSNLHSSEMSDVEVKLYFCLNSVVNAKKLIWNQAEQLYFRS